MTRDELLVFFPKHLTCAEIGVLAGDYSQAINATNPARLFLVDCWGHQDQSDYDDGANRPDDAQERLYRKVCDRFRYDPAVCILRGMSDVVLPHLRNLDWVYIDANHSYDASLNDMVTAAECIHADGFLAGHDYAQCSRSGAPFGVIQATQELSLIHI